MAAPSSGNTNDLPRFTTPDSNCSPKFGSFCRTLVWYSEPAGTGQIGTAGTTIASDVITSNDFTLTVDDIGLVIGLKHPLGLIYPQMFITEISFI